MDAVAWMLVGERGHRSLHLDSVRAFLQAPSVHGIVKPLVPAERVAECIRAAYEQGRIDERQAANRG
jgi:hypothetical protein